MRPDVGKTGHSILYKVISKALDLASQVYNIFYRQAISMVSMVRDHFRDKKMGIDTYGNASMIEKSLYGDAGEYAPISYEEMDGILAYLDPREDDIFVDLGCGMGRAVLLAASRRLKKSVGVELKEALIAAALDNLSGARGLMSPVELIHTDAATFDIKEGTIFFLYNPFGHKTTSKVADNIRRFSETAPKPVRIVYYGPQYRHIFDEAPWLELEKELCGGTTAIWRSKKI